MSRPIKFRAWDKGYNRREMVGPFILPHAPDSVRQFSWDFDFMQYTGLKDINGTEIYEGDVVNTVSAAPVIYQQIIYFPPEFMLQDKYGFHRLLAGVTEEFYEVIGNIHENPELVSCKN